MNLIEMYPAFEIHVLNGSLQLHIRIDEPVEFGIATRHQGKPSIKQGSLGRESGMERSLKVLARLPDAGNYHPSRRRKGKINAYRCSRSLESDQTSAGVKRKPGINVFQNKGLFDGIYGKVYSRTLNFKSERP